MFTPRQLLPCIIIGGIFPLLALFAGCSSNNATPLPTFTITTGAARTLAVAAAANGVVTDPASGLVFVFPAGATGTLTLASIIAAPARSLSGGQGYQLRFPQNVPISLRFPVPASGAQLAYFFTDAGGCYDGIARPTKEWQALPPRTSSDGKFLYFDLPRTAIDRMRRSATDEVIDYFWSLTVDPPPNATTLTTYVADARRALVTALPAAAQTSIIARQLEQPATIYFRDPTMGAYYYFTTLGANLYLRTDIDIITAYHETAHYMTHMLMTDAQWRVMQANAPQVHAIGDVFTRTSAIPDDYAYYLQWVMGQPSVDPINPSTLITPQVQPAQVDMPAVEGYVATLLGHLTFTTTPRRDFAKVMSEVPTIGATPGEVATLISNADLSLDALYPHLLQFVQARGYYVDTLAVLAERSGWSYHGSGTVMQNSQPAVGATVQPVIKYQTGTFPAAHNYTFTTPAATVDATGRYTLPRIFFGAITLRVTYNGTNKDIPFSVNREAPTNVALTIPPIELGDNKPVISSITPDAAMPDDIVTILGSNFGATQPLGGDVYIRPAYSTGVINPEITYWSDTAIRIKTPYGIDAPTQINVRNGTVAANPAGWLYIGDGHTFLNKLKSYESVQIGDVHELIGYQGGNVLCVFANQPVDTGWTKTHNIAWDGAKFTATLQRSGPIWVTETISSGAYAEQVTITGTVDPVRQVLRTVTASLRQEISGSAVLGNDIVTVSLTMQNLSGYRDDNSHRIPFGYFQGNVNGFPPIPITANTIVSYHFQKQSTGEDYTTPYVNPMFYQTDRNVVFSNL